jgi:lipoprotein-releasing system permease protein
MSPNFRIATRFLTAKKRAMLMSLACIVLGVGLFVVTQAITSGFERFFIRTILGTDGAIRIEDKIQDTMRSMEAGGRGSGSNFHISMRGEGKKYIEGIDEPKLLIAALRRFDNVAGISEVLHAPVTIHSSFKSDSVQVYGINLDDQIGVSDLGNQIVDGTLNDFRTRYNGAILGREMADRLQLAVGDSFILEAGSESRRYRVSAVYQTGVSDIDRVRGYLKMGEARSLLKKPTGASYLQLSLIDKDRAPEDALQMSATLGYSAASWEERERSWLQVFKALRLSSAITVSVFTLIAGLAMFNTLAMIVMEKTKEIAILRSMGYTRRDISRIFMWQAVIVLTAGTVVGWILGAGVTYGISKVPIRIRGIFATDHFIVTWSFYHYLAATVTAVVMVTVASLIPARRAARLEPGEVIRGTAQ